MKYQQNSGAPSPSSPAAEFISGNADLLEEILLRLPPKSLIKFKCVSKLWLFTVSSPQFCHRHARLHSSRRRPSGVLLRTNPNSIHSQYQFLPLDTDSPSGSSLNYVPHPAGIKVLQSCNGLLLCCGVKEIGHSRNYYVFNPTTNQHTLIPQLGNVSRSITVFGAGLAFDPSRSPHYKVVCVRSTETSVYHYQIELYSSEDRTWRLSGHPFVAPFDMVFDNGVFWNRAVHWISPSRSSLYFDVDKEQLRAMPRIPISRNCGTRRFRYFGQSNGNLHFFEIYGSQTTRFKVFEMERDYSQWFMKYEVELDSIVKEFPEIVQHYVDPGEMKYYYAFVMLLLVREGDDKDSSMLIHVPGKILSHNVADKSFKKLYEIPTNHNKGHGSLQYGWLDAYEFIESLAPI
ncbi:F-box protein At5g07610-like [Punica granatum]|uniref:F-box domain-containing protein n=2 Tax=Punica granatum TaxID=22663 RepID=A0A218XQ46_PUNGR|nr:F-box protein At5g07610-like [Punica granatum]OWM86908.1 hypothetical protein CDL15_Pgr015944 [Punica granatum]PKI38428.1 hypothetical protein CRG98_041208 [Punica granatum]